VVWRKAGMACHESGSAILGAGSCRAIKFMWRFFWQLCATFNTSMQYWQGDRTGKRSYEAVIAILPLAAERLDP